jgi:hypothetical protein
MSNTKYVNNKTRYVYTMPENFKPNVKPPFSRFRIIFSRNQAVPVGHNLFEFGFGIVQNKRFKSLMKIKCKTCLTSDGANVVVKKMDHMKFGYFCRSLQIVGNLQYFRVSRKMARHIHSVVYHR